MHMVQYNYTYRVLNKHTHSHTATHYPRGKCKNGKSEIVRTSPPARYCVNNTNNNNIT